MVVYSHSMYIYELYTMKQLTTQSQGEDEKEEEYAELCSSKADEQGSRHIFHATHWFFLFQVHWQTNEATGCNNSASSPSSQNLREIKYTYSLVPRARVIKNVNKTL